jgi:hypothetical protein
MFKKSKGFLKDLNNLSIKIQKKDNLTKKYSLHKKIILHINLLKPVP